MTEEKPIENEEFKAKIITNEGETLTLTIALSEKTESIKGTKVDWYEQSFTFAIVNRKRCFKLEKSSYPFYRVNRKTKKTELFFGYKIFHFQEVGNDVMTQEIDGYSDEDCQNALGISITRSEIKEVSKERLREILTHCEGDYSFFEGKLSQGTTKRF